MTRPASHIKSDIAHSEKWVKKYRREKSYWAAATHAERLPRLRAELRRSESKAVSSKAQRDHGDIG